MTRDSKPDPPVRSVGQIRLRSTIAFLVLSLMTGTLFLVFDLYEEQPPLDQPARTAISDASAILSQTYSDEKALVERFRTVHHRLESAVALLDRTERMDPADRRTIDDLRVQLHALEDPARLASTDPGRLKDRYRELIRRLNTLADRLAPSQP